MFRKSFLLRHQQLINTTNKKTNLLAPRHHQFNQNEFWAWCADRGVSCRRPLEITNNDLQGVGRSLVLSSEPIERAGSVVAAIPYQNPINGKSIVLNAETIPLGCLPQLLPLPDHLAMYWHKRYLKKSKKMLMMSAENNNNTMIEEEALLETFGPEERKFIWLAGILASAACDSTTPLFKYYAPYFNLMFSSSLSSSSFQRTKAISQFMSSKNKDDQVAKQEFARLEFLHQLASESLSNAMKRSAKRKRRVFKTHEIPVGPASGKKKSSGSSIHHNSNNNNNNEQQQQDDDDNEFIDHLPEGQLIYNCLLRVLSHSIAVGVGCPPSSSEDEDNNQNNGMLMTKQGKYLTSSSSEAENDDENDDEISSVPLLPSMIPIVDLLNHSETPNCDVVTTEASEVDGIRRIAIISRGAIQVDEPLTISYNVVNDNSSGGEGNNQEDNFQKALSLFRFGF